MARDFAKRFYNSKRWKDCRTAFLSEHPLCNRCLQVGLIVPAEHVHHVVELNENNINDPNITINFENLEALCEPCHSKETNQVAQVDDGFYFDEHGNLKKE